MIKNKTKWSNDEVETTKKMNKFMDTWNNRLINEIRNE